MKFGQQDKQEKMLTDNIENQEINNNKTNVPSIESELQNNIIDSISIKQQLNPEKINNELYNSNDIKKFDNNSKEGFIKNSNNINTLMKNKNESKCSNIHKNEDDKKYIDSQQNGNGNIDNLFDSDSSLSSVSIYESDDLSDDEVFNNNKIIKFDNEIKNDKSNNIKETFDNSLKNPEESDNNLYFDDSSSITSLSSLDYDDYLSTSSISPMKPKRKLNSDEKLESKRNTNDNNIPVIDLDNFVPRKKRRGRKKSNISNLSNSLHSTSMSNMTEEQEIQTIKKKRGRKRKNEKINYNSEQLQKINQNISIIWKNLCEKLNNTKPTNFEIPDNIIDDFEGLIKNPNNGNYINSYEWSIVKMSNDGKITPFLTSDAFIPKSIKCSKCQEIIKDDTKYYCEYCNSYYHYQCISKNNDKKYDFEKEIIQIDNPVDIFKQAYNLNLSNNYLVHNSDFKWCLQKKLICPYHSNKNPILKPKLKHNNIPEEKLKEKISLSNISSPKSHQEENSSTMNLKKSSLTQKKKKEDNKLNHLNSNITKIISNNKKRSRNFSTTSTGSNNKPEICLKKRENILLKFVSNNDSSSKPKKNIVLSKKKNIKLDPDVDTNIYINLKNEDLLSSNIIDKVIPNESLKCLKPEVKYKATEEQIKMNFINKVYKSSKEMEEWLYSLIQFHQDIIKQLHNKNIINTVPPTPPLNEPSTYLIDTLCSAIDYSKKEDEYTKLLFKKNQNNKNISNIDNNEIYNDNNIFKEKDLNLSSTNESSPFHSSKSTTHNNNSNDQSNTTNNKNENEHVITSDDNIPDIITKDSLIYKQYLYWKYICKNVIKH